MGKLAKLAEGKAKVREGRVVLSKRLHPYTRARLLLGALLMVVGIEAERSLHTGVHAIDLVVAIVAWFIHASGLAPWLQFLGIEGGE